MNFMCAPRMERRIRKRIAGTICVLGMVLLAGCTVGPNYKRPAAEVPPAYKEVGDWKTAQPNDQNLSGNWSARRLLPHGGRSSLSHPQLIFGQSATPQRTIQWRYFHRFTNSV